MASRRKTPYAWPKNLEIEITNDMAMNGITGDCSRCPTALAAIAAVPKMPGVYVEVGESVSFYRKTNTWPDKLASYDIPEKLNRKIQEFDECLDQPSSSPAQALKNIQKEAVKIVGKYTLDLVVAYDEDGNECSAEQSS
jgi:hypothetical protein